MNELELKGGTKKTRKIIEDYLNKIDFEERIMEICKETFVYGVEFEETESYNRFLEEFKQ